MVSCVGIGVLREFDNLAPREGGVSTLVAPRPRGETRVRTISGRLSAHPPPVPRSPGEAADRTYPHVPLGSPATTSLTTGVIVV